MPKLITSAAKLRQQFEADLAEMQRVCRHKKSEWMEYHWAPGHFNGTMVKVCNTCEKTLETKEPIIKMTSKKCTCNVEKS